MSAMGAGTTGSQCNLALNLPYSVEKAAPFPEDDSESGSRWARPDIGQLTDGIVGSSGGDDKTQHKDGTYVGFSRWLLPDDGDIQNDEACFYTFEIDLKNPNSLISDIYLEYLEWRGDGEGCPGEIRVYVDGDLKYTQPACTPASGNGRTHGAVTVPMPSETKGQRVKLEIVPYWGNNHYWWLFLSEIKVLSDVPDTEFKVEYHGYVDEIMFNNGDDPDSTFVCTMDNIIDTRDCAKSAADWETAAGGTPWLGYWNGTKYGGGRLPKNGNDFVLARCYIDGNHGIATEHKLAKLYKDKYYHRNKAPELENIDILAGNNDWELTRFQINDGAEQPVNSSNYADVFGKATVNNGDTVKLIYTPNDGRYTHKNPYFFDYDITNGLGSDNKYHTAQKINGVWYGCGINSPWPQIDFRSTPDCTVDSFNAAQGCAYKAAAHCVTNNDLQPEDWGNWHTGVLTNGTKNSNAKTEAKEIGWASSAWPSVSIDKEIKICFNLVAPKVITEVNSYFCNIRATLNASGYKGNRGYPEWVDAYVSSTEFSCESSEKLGRSDWHAPGNVEEMKQYHIVGGTPKTGKYLTLVVKIPSAGYCRYTQGRSDGTSADSNDAVVAIAEVEAFTKRSPFIAFGNANTGTPYATDQAPRNYLMWEGQLLNQFNGNNTKPNSKNGCTFGMVEDTLLRPGDPGWGDRNSNHYNSGLEFKVKVDDPYWYNNTSVMSHSAAPCMFKHKSSGNKRRYFDDMSLGFARKGDSYTLSSVGAKNGSDEAYISGLNEFTPLKIDDNKFIYSNMFWPMDTRNDDTSCNNEPAKDPLFGDETHPRYFQGVNKNGTVRDGHFPRSDDSYFKTGSDVDHNSYFGMHFDMEFYLTNDYVGPLNYFFYGDDDMWVYLDKKLICDIGGVHSSIGELVNLWDWLSPYKTGKHTLSFYYTERGASGSSCYMRFNLPGLSEVPDPAETGSLLVAKNVTAKTGFTAPTGARFKLEISLKNSDNTPYTDEKRISVYSDYEQYYATGRYGVLKSFVPISGTATVELEDKQFAVIENLPAGVTYTVREVVGTDNSYEVSATADRIAASFSNPSAPADTAALSNDFTYTSCTNVTDIAASCLSRVHFENKFPLGGALLPNTGGIGREALPIVGLTAVIFSSLAPVVLRSDKKRKRAGNRSRVNRN